MSRLSRSELMALPNKVLLDPVTGNAAAYDATHRLITEHASSELVTYARRKAYMHAMWDESKHDPTGRWHPLPAWATPDVRPRCVFLWVRRGGETEEELRSIPSR